MKEIIEAYFRALEAGNVQALIELFSDDGLVHSPLYGRMEAAAFYESLLKDSRQSSIRLLHIFESKDQPMVWAAHFMYDWILQDGTQTKFECVDFFYFTPQNKISALTIIYDTAATRSGIDRLRQASLPASNIEP